MNNQSNKLFNRDMKQAISLAIKIKDQQDKSKKFRPIKLEIVESEVVL